MKLPQLSFSGQLIALLLAALVVAQALSFVVFTGDREQAVRAANRAGLLESMASIMRVLAGTDPRDARTAGGSRLDAAHPLLDQRRERDSRDGRIGQVNLPAVQFERLFPGAAPRVRRGWSSATATSPTVALASGTTPATTMIGADPNFFRGEFDVLASVPFAEGGWLNAQTRIRAEPVPIPWPSLISAGLMAVAILVIVGLIVRRATRPLALLADRVEAFGRGAPSVTLPETGPREVRRLTAAFNRMQDRLARFIADRTRMLAAIGHDLRTPITSLKIRTELLDDEEARTKMMATLDEMQRMTEATLAFAREDADAEPLRSVDLNALVESLCDDLAAMGKDVTFTGEDRLPYPCRPTALRRAVGNLVENAVRYGDRARVTLQATPDGPLVTIDDDGPGIPAGQIEEVYKPFVRLETSRSRETGGAGLGLSIARSIVLAHGGELTLSNRKEGGLHVEIRLPKAETT